MAAVKAKCGDEGRCCRIGNEERKRISYKKKKRKFGHVSPPEGGKQPGEAIQIAGELSHVIGFFCCALYPLQKPCGC